MFLLVHSIPHIELALSPIFSHWLYINYLSTQLFFFLQKWDQIVYLALDTVLFT